MCDHRIDCGLVRRDGGPAGNARRPTLPFDSDISIVVVFIIDFSSLV